MNYAAVSRAGEHSELRLSLQQKNIRVLRRKGSRYRTANDSATDHDDIHLIHRCLS